MDRLLLYHVLLYGSCGYALIRGNTDSRVVALAFLIGNYATYALRSPLAVSYSSVEPGILAIDIAAWIAYTYVALASDRFWPLWVSGLQLTASLGHVLKAIDADLLPLAYAAALRFWSYPILLILAVGVWRHRKRLQREQAPTAA